MKTPVNRQTVDLAAYPELVVIYLGMRVNALAGIKMLAGIGPSIQKAGESKPDGLLHFENNIIYSIFPFHVGMRWYWKDFESMERWTRSAPHKDWWQAFIRNSGGTGFWHETYFMGGGMEAIYDDLPKPIGFKAFPPVIAARGSSFTARRRLGRTGADLQQPEGNSETEIY